MSTFDQLTDSTLLYLYGFTTLQDQATYLTSQASASALTLNVADATTISRGVLEIGDELIWADNVDTSALTATIPPYGRGYRGTTATTHASGTRVVSSPLFPRHLVKQAINESIRAVFPDLMGLGTSTFTYLPAVSTFSLPAGALDVIQVSWQSIGPSREWFPIRRWRVDKHANTTAFASGATLSLYERIVPGRTVQVVYTKQPSVLSAGSDDFTDVTGLPASSEDVIRLGAAYRMVPFFDSPHLSGMSAEADFAANQRPVGASAQLGRFLLQQYQVRLTEEARRLQSIYPVRSHYTR
jgi:hypothetical protein